MPQILGPEVPVPSDGSSHRLPSRQRGTYIVPHLHNVLALASGNNRAATVLNHIVIGVPRTTKLEHGVVSVGKPRNGSFQTIILHRTILA